MSNLVEHFKYGNGLICGKVENYNDTIAGTFDTTTCKECIRLLQPIKEAFPIGLAGQSIFDGRPIVKLSRFFNQFSSVTTERAFKVFEKIMKARAEE